MIGFSCFYTKFRNGFEKNVLCMCVCINKKRKGKKSLDNKRAERLLDEHSIKWYPLWLCHSIVCSSDGCFASLAMEVEAYSVPFFWVAKPTNAYSFLFFLSWRVKHHIKRFDDSSRYARLHIKIKGINWFPMNFYEKFRIKSWKEKINHVKGNWLI